MLGDGDVGDGHDHDGGNGDGTTMLRMVVMTTAMCLCG